MTEPSTYSLKVLCGNANRKLAEDVCQAMEVELGAARVGQYANGEISIKIDSNVRGDDVFIIQPTCGNDQIDINTSVMELLLMIHTLRLASAKRVTAVIPHFAYARQDRKTQGRVPISASAVAQLILSQGVDRVVTVDLHCGQIQGFFHNTPVDNLYGYFSFATYFKQQFGSATKGLAVVAPDAGAVEKARNMADQLGAESVATILKRRVEANKVDTMQIVGHVEGKNCIIVDDMCDTAGTLVKACDLLKENGALDIYACVTHGIFSDPACERMSKCPSLKQILTTDSIPQEKHVAACDKLKVIPLAPLLGKAIHAIHNEASLSSLFDPATFVGDA